MAIWTNGGTLVVDGSGKPIDCATCPCNEGTCELGCCNAGRWPDTIQCDLGTLGWVDNGCDACDTLGGVYELAYNAGLSTPSTSCVWTYDSGEICDFPYMCGLSLRTARASLLITATLNSDCDWTVDVALDIRGLDDACASPQKTATYELANSDEEDCDCMELTKTSDNSALGVFDDTCDGDFPDTIILSRSDSICPEPDGFALPEALAFMAIGNGFEFVAAGNEEFADVLSLT